MEAACDGQRLEPRAMGETVLLALTPPESEAAEEACLRLSKRGPVNLSLGGLFPDNSGIPFTAARGGDLVLSLDSRWVHRFLQLIPDSAGGRTLEARLREAAASNGPRRLRSSEISDPGWYRANPVAPVGHGAVRKPVRVYEVRLLPESAWPVR